MYNTFLKSGWVRDFKFALYKHWYLWPDKEVTNKYWNFKYLKKIVILKVYLFCFFLFIEYKPLCGFIKYSKFTLKLIQNFMNWLNEFYFFKIQRSCRREVFKFCRVCDLEELNPVLTGGEKCDTETLCRVATATDAFQKLKKRIDTLENMLRTKKRVLKYQIYLSSHMAITSQTEKRLRTNENVVL